MCPNCPYGIREGNCKKIFSRIPSCRATPDLKPYSPKPYSARFQRECCPWETLLLPPCLSLPRTDWRSKGPRKVILLLQSRPSRSASAPSRHKGTLSGFLFHETTARRKLSELDEDTCSVRGQPLSLGSPTPSPDSQKTLSEEKRWILPIS